MIKIATSLLFGAALVAAPAFAQTNEAPRVELAKMLEGRVAGEPVNCISTFGTTSSQIIEGTAIVYRSGGRLWVNEPRAGASSLEEDDVLVTRTFGSQLCNTDPVHLVDRAGGFQRGFVMLGKFVPYTKAN